jgi:hypothetical protein
MHHGKSLTNQFFIVGVQRSGTTLLRNILNAHPNIIVGYECAFYKILSNKWIHESDIKQGVEDFLNDLYLVKRFDFWEIERSKLKARLLDFPGNLTFKSAIQIINSLLIEQSEKDVKILGIKNPNGVFHIDFILRTWPEAKVVHIVRDIRGVLASEKKKRKKQHKYDRFKSIWFVAAQFYYMSKAHQKFQNNKRVKIVKYKDLIMGVELESKRICEFLEINWHENLSYHSAFAKIDNYVPNNELWQHSLSIERPDPARIKAFEKELTKNEIKSIELLSIFSGRKINEEIQLNYTHIMALPILAIWGSKYVIKKLLKF